MKAIIKSAPEPGGLVWGAWPEPALRPGLQRLKGVRESARVCGSWVLTHGGSRCGGFSRYSDLAAIAEELDETQDPMSLGRQVCTQILVRRSFDGARHRRPFR